MDNPTKILSQKEEECKEHGKYIRYKVLFINQNHELEIGCPTCFKIKKEEEYQKEVKKYIQDNRNEYKQSVVNKLFNRSQIPPIYDNFTIDNLMQGTKDPKNIERVLKYCDNLKENLSEGKGFIFVGTKGNGKSNAAICIAKECIKKQYSALFITSLDMFDHINAAITDGTTIEARIKELISIDLLVIDEIVAKMTDGDHKTLFKIINGRWEYKKSTILTSNLDIKSDNPNEITLKSTLGERIMDRLRDKNTCLRFTGESLRGK